MTIVLFIVCIVAWLLADKNDGNTSLKSDLLTCVSIFAGGAAVASLFL